MNIQEQIKGMTEFERSEFLEAHAASIVEGQYFRPFDGEDKAATQNDFSIKSIELRRVVDEFEAIKQTFKQKIKAIEKEREIMMQNLMQNGEWLDGKQFGFDDQVAGTMTFFDEHGQFINSRRLTPSERQLKITSQFSKAN